MGEYIPAGSTGKEDSSAKVERRVKPADSASNSSREKQAAIAGPKKAQRAGPASNNGNAEMAKGQVSQIQPFAQEFGRISLGTIERFSGWHTSVRVNYGFLVAYRISVRQFHGRQTRKLGRGSGEQFLFSQFAINRHLSGLQVHAEMDDFGMRIYAPICTRRSERPPGVTRFGKETPAIAQVGLTGTPSDFV